LTDKESYFAAAEKQFRIIKVLIDGFAEEGLRETVIIGDARWHGPKQCFEIRVGDEWFDAASIAKERPVLCSQVTSQAEDFYLGAIVARNAVAAQIHASNEKVMLFLSGLQEVEEDGEEHVATDIGVGGESG